MNNQIKESFDNLPIAVCFFDSHGIVRLINHRMLALAGILSKNGIQTLSELRKVLLEPPSDICCLNPQLKIFRFPDETVFRFDEELLKTKSGKRYTQVTASDISELMQEQARLKDENDKLAETNRRLRKLFEQMPELIREKETLEMKQRVHDDLGHGILAARRALLGDASLEDIKANASLWERSIAVLHRSNQMTASLNPMEAAIRRASEMGVDVLLDGNAPAEEDALMLAALAIRECAANCVRHADATKLYVIFRQEDEHTTMFLTNNGIVPKEEIREGGGLSMLRHNVEQAGGSMKIQSIPRFRLMLDLPTHTDMGVIKEGTTYAGNDC